MSNHFPSHELVVVYRPIHKLRPNKRNPRTHTKAQVAKLADSIQEFGFVVPVLIGKGNRAYA